MHPPPGLGQDKSALPQLSEASLVSRLFFSWLTPLVKLGAKRPLETTDLCGIEPRDDPGRLAQLLQSEWDVRKRRTESWWALAASIWAIVWRESSWVGLSLLLANLCELALPMVFSWLIQSLSDQDATRLDGMCCVGLVLVVSVMHLVFAQMFEFRKERMSMNVSSMLSAMVYRKSLRLQQVSQGNATNAMSVDPNKVAVFGSHLHHIWLGPLQLALSVYLLYRWLGPAAFASLAITIVAMLIKHFTYKGAVATRTKIMKLSDERVKRITESLHGMLIVKLFCLEDHVMRQISTVRAQEVALLKKLANLQARMMFLMLSQLIFATAGTFSVYVLLGNDLVPHLVFPSLSIFASLLRILLELPRMTSRWSEAKVSFERLNKFLRLKELNNRLTEQVQHVEHDDNTRIQDSKGDEAASDVVLAIVQGAFEWEARNDEDKVKGPEALGDSSTTTTTIRSDDNAAAAAEEPRGFRLHDIDLEVRRGELVAIVGRVGSGKSSLLSGILGEMKHVAGQLRRRTSSTSYASQRAWIRNATVRENVLFGQAFDASLYRDVIRVCALDDDLRALPARDMTEIGENGINLSGGQKQRVALARAVYFSCLAAAREKMSSVILLDDVLSAVDAHVGQRIFRECLLDKLAGITRVLVTHQLQYLPLVDRICVMRDGTIETSGTYAQLIAQGVDFEGLLLDNSNNTKDNLNDDRERDQVTDTNAAMGAVMHHSEAETEEEEEEERGDGEEEEKEQIVKGRLIRDEERQTGAVDWRVYWQYLIGAGTAGFLPLMLLISLASEGVEAFSRLWLALWSSDASADTTHNLTIYFVAAVVSSLLVFGRQFLWVRGTLNCARRMHERLLFAIFRAPMTFFFTTPTGRIISRFSKDQGQVDQEVPELMSDVLMCLFNSLGTLLLICGVLPWLLLPVLPVIGVYWWLRQFYRKTSRELGRLESITSSPIYAQYAETLEGLDTIRAFGIGPHLTEESERLLIDNLRACFCNYTSNCWLGVRVEGVGTFVMLAIATLGAMTKGSLSVGFIGLLLAFANNLTSDLTWLVRLGTMLESDMNHVERLLQYTAVPAEAPLALAMGQRWDAKRRQIVERCDDASSEARGCSTAEDDTVAQWPTEGRVEFKNVWMRYRDELEHVLKGIDLVLEPNQTVGVLGRTGAGKSSLINALFRLVELDQGEIRIDGVDISSLGLHRVRSALAIIPQDPVLFSGTVRSNVDPLGQHTDEVLLAALGKAHLPDKLVKLDTELEANGRNLSVGQRQLLCMARALLNQDARVLILDEATASVDNETDRAIQDTLTQEFAGRTVVVVAHRLHTVIEMDRVIVMDQGRVVESGSPWELLSTEASQEGPFARLVECTGPASAHSLRAKAFAHHQQKQKQQSRHEGRRNPSQPVADAQSHGGQQQRQEEDAAGGLARRRPRPAGDQS